MKHIPALPGFYILTHTPTGYYYGGHSRDLKRRITEHKHHYQRGSGGNSKFQEVFTTWEEIDIQIEIFDTVELARKREVAFLKNFLGFRRCCNLSGWGDKSMSEDLADILRRSANNRLGNEHPCDGNTTVKRWRWSAESRELASIVGNSSTKALAHRAKMKERFAKPVSIDGVVYASIGDAAKGLGIAPVTVIRRVASERFEDWFYVKRLS